MREILDGFDRDSALSRRCQQGKRWRYPSRVPPPSALSEPRPSWYLDPAVAAQKQAVHLALVSRWLPTRPARLLKTDLFEEAHGADQLLFEMCRTCDAAIGMDIDLAVVQRARGRCPAGAHPQLVAMDARAIGLADDSVDAVLSNSTLDHFESKEGFVQALGELTRVLAPGGTLILSVDNVLNPLYWPLRW